MIALGAISAFGWWVVSVVQAGDTASIIAAIGAWVAFVLAAIFATHKLAVHTGQRAKPRDPDEPDPQHIP